MTVLRPSLPPFSSTTTSTVSLLLAAARAVDARKPGTVELRAISDEPRKVRSRNRRRFNLARAGGLIGSLNLLFPPPTTAQAVLCRARIVDEFSQAWAPSHPFTLGGANSDWPIPSSVLARADGGTWPPRLRIRPTTY